MDASPGDGRGGGGRRGCGPDYVTSSLCTPPPPHGGHARWWGPKEVWVEFLQPQRPLWHLCRGFVAGVYVLVDGDTPPHTLTHMHSRGRLLCKRVGGGVLWVLSALKHWFHRSRNPGDGPLPLQVPTFPRKEKSLLIHPNQEVLPRESLPLILPGSPSWFLCLNSFPTCIAHNQHSHMHLPCIFLMSGPETP